MPKVAYISELTLNFSNCVRCFLRWLTAIVATLLSIFIYPHTISHTFLSAIDHVCAGYISEVFSDCSNYPQGTIKDHVHIFLHLYYKARRTQSVYTDNMLYSILLGARLMPASFVIMLGPWKDSSPLLFLLWPLLLLFVGCLFYEPFFLLLWNFNFHRRPLRKLINQNVCANKAPK